MRQIFAIFIIFSCAFGFLTNASHASDTIVITDIDDTVRLLGLKAYGGPRIAANFLNMNTAFIGMPQLLTALQIQGFKIIYVSGIKKNLHKVSQRFLDKNSFPKGTLHFKADSDASTEDYKVAEIKKILTTEEPTAKIIFIGDNGQQDIAVYETITKDPAFSGRVLGTFIHALYQDSVSQALPANQVPWVTAGDLALRLHDMGITATSTLISEIDLTIKALTATSAWTRTLAIPEFTCVRPDFVSGLRTRAAEESNPTLRLYLLELSEQIAAHGARFFEDDWAARLNCAPHEFAFSTPN